ncbi:phosphoribosylglycinamide formyltransferase [Niabella ginsengisoli]|uniref:Phosphoribosylglycinamide formyltransferase n=1 Tax=Niabella ginsengisoli TaxID=522298 RepID=A0ABS9SN36_9BACT|nr:phosphoribosylglycinamide formyltransferase [Niabella ginsengisoli]MCH5599755.1 phosphoribosylglycinamide formyltransferase [Niabella ginsengisoli]
MKTRLAIFASGAGSNAQKIIDHFKNSPLAEVALIGCNKPNAGVLNIATKENIDSFIIEREQYKKDGYTDFLHEKRIDFIILAGFLWKIPQPLIDAYPRKIINIHPALLPNYGGKGMYGSFVHEAVITNKEKQSGISIHYVDEHYDHGDIIFQATCDIVTGDTPDSLAQKIHQLEHEHFPRVIEEWLVGNSK